MSGGIVVVVVSGGIVVVVVSGGIVVVVVSGGIVVVVVSRRIVGVVPSGFVAVLPGAGPKGNVDVPSERLVRGNADVGANSGAGARLVMVGAASMRRGAGVVELRTSVVGDLDGPPARTYAPGELLSLRRKPEASSPTASTMTADSTK